MYSSDSVGSSEGLSPTSNRWKWIQETGRWCLSHKVIVGVIVLFIFLILEYLSLPGSEEIIMLRRVNPQSTALMEQRKAEAARANKPYRIDWQWTPISRVSEHLIRAVIIAEDGSFYDHDGIDWFEVKESIKKDVQKRRFARGASTITQQLAKNLFLSTSKDPVRKLREVVIASQLESHLTKKRILELYVNSIEWGRGIFGIEAASLRYFGKLPVDLTREEAARLAAVIPSPLRHTPVEDSKFMRYRMNLILKRMDQRGW